MKTQKYTSAWQYFYETEANNTEEQDTPLLPETADAPPTVEEIILSVSFTTSEWEMLKNQSGQINITPEEFIKQILFKNSL